MGPGGVKPAAAARCSAVVAGGRAPREPLRVRAALREGRRLVRRDPGAHDARGSPRLPDRRRREHDGRRRARAPCAFSPAVPGTRSSAAASARFTSGTSASSSHSPLLPRSCRRRTPNDATAEAVHRRGQRGEAEDGATSALPSAKAITGATRTREAIEAPKPTTACHTRSVDDELGAPDPAAEVQRRPAARRLPPGVVRGAGGRHRSCGCASYQRAAAGPNRSPRHRAARLERHRRARGRQRHGVAHPDPALGARLHHQPQAPRPAAAGRCRSGRGP
jgi:hypothetical protein